MSLSPVTAIDDELEQAGKPAGPCAMVVFGATGDLTMRKLVPALYNLDKAHLLPIQFAVVGVAIDDIGLEEFRARVTRLLPLEEQGSDVLERFVQSLHYMRGDFGDAATFSKLGEILAKIDKQIGTDRNYLFYMATAPKFFSAIVEQLGASGLSREENGHWRRVVIEKPFGNDLESALALNKQIKSILSEKQIFRIDHYLGKETVQNIMVFRFGNGIFEPIWNRRYIDHVAITNAETVGVEMRGGYFDNAGTLRDMVPNHMMQLISLTAMEPPASFSADAVRDEQAKVLNAIQPLSSEDGLQQAVRGQYGEGVVLKEKVQAYRIEPGVSPESKTETFVAMKLNIDNWRWAGVPFYLRTGKRLAKRQTAVHKLQANRLVIQIQPDEGMALGFGAKIPGPQLRLGSVEMSFEYSKYFGAEPYTGYEVLLYDCMMGDQTLFQRADMVEAGWRILDPVIDVWRALPPRNFPNYPASSWGPKEADDLMERDGRHWRTIE